MFLWSVVTIQLTLEHQGLNCKGLLTDFFWHGTAWNVLLWFSKSFFQLYYKNTVYNIQNMCWSTVGIIRFLESQKLHEDFLLQGGSVPLTPALFKDQLYMYMTNETKWKKDKVSWVTSKEIKWKLGFMHITRYKTWYI